MSEWINSLRSTLNCLFTFINHNIQARVHVRQDVIRSWARVEAKLHSILSLIISLLLSRFINLRSQLVWACMVTILLSIRELWLCTARLCTAHVGQYRYRANVKTTLFKIKIVLGRTAQGLQMYYFWKRSMATTRFEITFLNNIFLFASCICLLLQAIWTVT